MQYTTIPAGAKPPAASLSPDTLRSSGGLQQPWSFSQPTGGKYVNKSLGR